MVWSQRPTLILGCNSCIGTAIDGSCQHHETHDATHHPRDDDGGDGVTQVGWPRLGFELTLGAVALGRLQGSPVGRAGLLNP